MYAFLLIVVGITGIVSLVDIALGLKDMNEGIKILVNLSNVFFFVSLLFFVSKSGKSDKHEKQ
ncbi:hypothetical protein [Peribacillus muralis]|uniref:hypothetical protein n=1 Tax=Peribacillus muralis TaxID=264697 RepID=UPI003D038D84